MYITDAVDLYNPAIQKMFLKTADLDKEEYKQYFYVETGVEDLIRKDSSLSGLGEADFVGSENALIAGDSPVQGYDKTYTQEMVAVLMAFTWKDWKFGIKKRKMESLTKELRMAVVRKRDRLCAERVNNAFATSYSASGLNGARTITTTGGDGLAAASASHTREDGGSNWSNIVTDASGTVNLPFGLAGLKAAHRTAANIPDPRGNPMDLNLDLLVCAKGSNVSFKAKEILGAIKRGDIPESANNDGSGVQAFKVLELPPQYMTNTEYWAMVDSSKIGPEYGFQFLESTPIMLDAPNVVYKTKEIQYTAYTSFDLGHNDPRVWVFSKGTSAA
jgi:hypothetical protein